MNGRTRRLKRIYFVRVYSYDPNCLPDSQIPCTSLKDAKKVARNLVFDFYTPKFFPISKFKASDFNKYGDYDVLVVGINNRAFPNERDDALETVTIEICDDAGIIADWWNGVEFVD